MSEKRITANRIPQRFAWKDTPDSEWEYGVCFPRESSGFRFWLIRAGNGYCDFNEDPWESLGDVLGCPADFKWLDTDYGWATMEKPVDTSEAKG